MITVKDIGDFVARNNLNDSIICLHSSLRSFGKIEHGPNTIIDGLLQNDCTIVCPAFYYESETFPPKANYISNGIDYSVIAAMPQKNYTNDSGQIVPSMGAVPRAMLQYENSVRTDNPLNSFVVIGNKSEELCVSQSLLNAYSVYKNIYQNNMNAYIVLAGVSFTSCTPIHYAEEVAGKVLFRRWAIHRDQTVEVEVGSCSDGFEKIASYTKDIEINDTIGRSNIRMYPFSDFIKRVSRIIREDPEVTRCDDLKCLRCRDMISGGRR